jgi:cyclic pyranopterin phosphate synthase
MPLGGRGQMDSGHYLSLESVRRLLDARWTLEPLAQGSGGPAAYVRVAETGRRLGFITPMSHRFCLDCNRIRLTCTGRLVLCLAREGGVDLRHPLRRGASDDTIADVIAAAVALKPLEHDFHSGLAATSVVQRMWQVGG